MAELGTAAAILQLAGTATQSALQLYDFFSVIRHAPKEIAVISRDVHTFYTLVQGLETSLASDTVRALVDRDPELATSLQTLQAPMENCCRAFDKIRDKLKPHLKQDTGTSSGEPTTTRESVRISRGDVLWYFRRRDVYALTAELERTKATFGDAMGSITLQLTLKTSAALHGHAVMPTDYAFTDDVGSALSKYAASVVDLELDHSGTASTIQTHNLETPSPEWKTRNDPKWAEELRSAVLGGSLFLVTTVLQHVHVDAQDRRGRTALSHASQHGNLPIVNLLLEEGASPRIHQYSINWARGHEPNWENGACPLHWAARGGHLEIVELLLSHGANPNARTTSGRTALQEACKGGSAQMVRLLLSKGGDVNSRTYNEGWTPLHEAVHYGYMNIIPLLIEHSALLDTPLTPYEKTPLHTAVIAKALDRVKLLLKHGADPSPPMMEDITPLHLAAAAGWNAGIEALVGSGAQINAADAILRETALHKAARNRHMETVDKLCGLGADQEVKNVDGHDYRVLLKLAGEAPGEWKVCHDHATFMSPPAFHW